MDCLVYDKVFVLSTKGSTSSGIIIKGCLHCFVQITTFLRKEVKEKTAKGSTGCRVDVLMGYEKLLDSQVSRRMRISCKAPVIKEFWQKL